MSDRGVVFEYNEPIDLFGLIKRAPTVEAFIRNKIEGDYLYYFKLSFSLEDEKINIESIKKGDYVETNDLRVLEAIYRESFIL